MPDTTDSMPESHDFIPENIDAFLSAWAAAELAGDRDQLEVLLSDDFVGIGPLGFCLTKPEWITRHEQNLHYQAFSVQDAEVRRYAEVAVVIARDNQHGTAFGHPVPEALRATHVLRRHAGIWRLAALHLSFIAGTPGAPPIPGAPSHDSVGKP